MADADVIRSIRSQTLQLIADITASPKPGYSIDGQSVAWSDYLKQLEATVAWCDRQLRGDEPCEVHSTGYTP